ncbi:alpha/beta hydrolase [Micromonospora sp. 4G57]|uniref:Alpha/beta hydrolase n=1 Tax=Micromonospora sicca TaxID=2202420 RepID=A0ABU5JGC6_9ACTN|nr:MULTISPECIES: alpha/beta hydrolase [unclassified Micromonospora]MDZ5445731.1 alpha/beta hydrolase [Micromonospora sp. 4G57]MDZ5491667.1 alpha/beta hydrolase [Micromonospora sp. 4G53]
MTLAHDVAGSGPTVVLLHSTACDRRMWDPQLPILADAGFRVVRSDMRGYGDSPVPDGPYNNAQDVVELLDLLGAEEFALVGSSGGGRVALEIAARWPYRVTGLALLCTALAGHEPSAELRAFGEREDALLEAGDVSEATDLNVDTLLGPHADQATREKVREMQRRAFDVQLAAVEEFPQLRPEFDRADITAATLLISGDHDLPDFRQIALRLSRELADARHLELDWAGHLPSLERPEAVNPLLLDFLRGTHAGSGRDLRS